MASKDVNRLPDLVRAFQELDHKTVKVGTFPEYDREQYSANMAHEYGCSIRITQAVARALAVKSPGGLDPGGGAGFIQIPESAWLRNTFDAKNDEWQEKFWLIYDGLIEGTYTDSHEMLRLLGASAVDDIRTTVQNLFTMRTGSMLESIRYKVE